MGVGERERITAMDLEFQFGKVESSGEFWRWLTVNVLGAKQLYLQTVEGMVAYTILASLQEAEAGRL